MFSDDFYANAACVCLIVVVLGFWVCFLRDYMALSVCQLVLLRVEGEWRGHHSFPWQFGDTASPLAANDDAAWHPCIRARLCFCVCVYIISIYACVLACMRLCVDFGASMRLCSLLCVWNICISLHSASVTSFGVTDNDLELLRFWWMCQIQAMDLDVCVCVCVFYNFIWNQRRNAISPFTSALMSWLRGASRAKMLISYCALLLLTLTSVASFT